MPSRIFYIFVGLAPLILLITGFVTWRYPYQAKTTNSDAYGNPKQKRLI
ncbi:hypothetical protein [Nostoc sp.]